MGQSISPFSQGDVTKHPHVYPWVTDSPIRWSYEISFTTRRFIQFWGLAYRVGRNVAPP